MRREFRKATLREYFESIVIAVILALFIRTFVVQAFKIPTGSMENNLLIGDHLLVNKFVYGPTMSRLERMLLPIKDIRRGDIIVFKFPEDPERDFIKRTIGLPGDTIELRNKKVYVNGKPLDEPYVHYLFPPPGDSPQEDFDVRVHYGPVTVPANHYFMMGDNRDNSEDSRYWGFLPREYVKGKAAFIYWSFEDNEEGQPSSGIARFFTTIRWGRLFHQIHWSGGRRGPTLWSAGARAEKSRVGRALSGPGRDSHEDHHQAPDRHRHHQRRGAGRPGRRQVLPAQGPVPAAGDLRRERDARRPAESHPRTGDGAPAAAPVRGHH